MNITKGERIVLTEPYGKLEKVGTVYEVASFIRDNNKESVVIRDTGKRMAVGCISLDIIDDYFTKESDSRKWSSWMRLVNGHGDIIGYTRSNGKRVQVKSLDGVKGTASCNVGDRFILDFGVQLAALRCRNKVLKKEWSYHFEQMEDIVKAMNETDGKINDLLKQLE